MTDILLRPEEVARRLGTTVGTLAFRRSKKVNNGPPFIKLGARSVRYSEIALNQWIAEQSKK